jgi:uncharacterized phage protein (TIGR01671 family)
MRQIKFRAWNRYNGMMEVVETSNHFTGVTCEWDFEAGGWRSKDTFMVSEQAAKDGGKHSCVLMQFTGLKDKNGKEIYEGDIVLTKGERWAVQWHVGTIGFIFDTDPNDRDSDALRFSNKRASRTSDDGIALHVEVIGNIYENPELLNPPCKSGLAPHDYDVNDQGDQVDLKCRNCGHTKTK